MGTSGQSSLHLSQGQTYFDKDCNFILSIMEKKVENPKSSIKDAVVIDDGTVQENLINGKELVQLFQKMTVARDQKVPVSTSNTSKTEAKSIIHRIHPSSRLKKKSKVNKKTRKIQLRPSKLTQVIAVKTDSKKVSQEAESRFIDFSADCSRALETIAKENSEKDASGTDPEYEDKRSKSARNTKRKTSCAQQARSECLPSSEAVNLSIDILTDYLDEAILFPKKMSYMAELMYT